MRTSVHGDRAVPALPLSGVVENRDRLWRLHDLTEPGEVGQDRRQTTLTEAPFLRTVGTIDVSTPWNQVGRRVELERLGSS